AGLTTGPQSIAQVTRLTCSVLPSGTATSATWATIDPNEARKAIPRPEPAGSGAPQPASLAAVSSTFRWRGCFANSSRRNSNGSFFSAAASSSTKLSSKKAVCEWPTERQNPTGTATSGTTTSSLQNGKAYGGF